ncbi:MAG: outer membrane lipoprotein carrier protein LolA [Deltaproteobacteria bacterium]|nr:outer membrane lipoprotein carrier protein LolA [Deltaproteobacteria bacterium]
MAMWAKARSAVLAAALAASGAGIAAAEASGAVGAGVAADAAASPAGGAVNAVGAGCAAQIAARVEQRYRAVRDLSADFEQSSHSAAMPGAPSLSSGRLVITRSGRLHFRYERPAPSLVVSDGETLWIADPVAKEVQVLRAEGGFLAGTALQVLVGGGRIADAFEASAEGCGGGTVRLILAPREAAHYERIELQVAAESGEVQGVALADVLGNITRTALRGVAVNQDPAPELFHYAPAPGERLLRFPR